MRRDPMERLVEEALDEAGIKHVGEEDPRSKRLDFFLPELGVHIEVKRFHTDRLDAQMARVENCIALQGVEAVEAFCALIKPHPLY